MNPSTQRPRPRQRPRQRLQPPSSVRMLSRLSLGLFLLGYCVSSATAQAQAPQGCLVQNLQGDDVTQDLWVDDSSSLTGTSEEGFVQCQGSRACQNFTITNCPAVKCDGSEACYFASITGIDRLLDCHEKHSCHRAVIEFTTPTESEVEVEIEETNDAESERQLPKPIPQQTISCQGEGACDVAQISAPHAHLECFGRKACRKVLADVDVAHCTNGDDYYFACTGYAGLNANCIICGWNGCDSHVNICRYKTDEAEKWTPCHPGEAVGPTCTAKQIADVAEEMDTHGVFLTAAESSQDEAAHAAEEEAAEGEDEEVT